MRKIPFVNRTPQKRKTFPAAISDLAENDPQGKVVIYERHGAKNLYIDQIPVLDALDIAADIESTLSDEYGGGEYQLSLVKSDSELVENHNFSIAGPPKGRDDGSESKRGMKNNPDRDMLTQMIGKLADAAIGRQGSSGEEFERSLRLAKELHGGDADIKEMQKDFMAMSIQNLMTPKETQIEEFLKIYQMIQQIQPTLQPDDPMSAVISGLMPLLGQIVGAKMSGGAAKPSPAQLQQIQGYLEQAGVDPAVLQGLQQQPGQQLSSAGMAAVPKPGEASQPEAIMENLILQFRQSILAGAPPETLARQIVNLTDNALLWTPQNPPPVLRGLIYAMTTAEYQVEIKKFFAAIPELAGNAELQAQIISELIKIITRIRKENVKTDVETTRREESPTPPPGAVTYSPAEVPTPTNIAEAAEEESPMETLVNEMPSPPPAKEVI